ncbi:hypothetical protein N9S46_00750 [Alphaproteobacteria bacterium]|nr:hypothetical protein [Alphaproteobacteria bacterium]
MFYRFLFIFKFLFFISINLNAGLFDDVNKALNQVTENLSNETKTNKNTNSVNDTEPAKDLPSSGDILFFDPSVNGSYNPDTQRWYDYSLLTKKTQKAPRNCYNFNSTKIMERKKAKENFPNYMRWYRDCGEYYPDALIPKRNWEAECAQMGQETCQTAMQLEKIQKLLDQSYLNYSYAIAMIADAIGLKEEAEDLFALLAYIEDPFVKETRSYHDATSIVWINTIDLSEKIFEKMNSGYIPSDQEIILLQQADAIRIQAHNDQMLALKEAKKLQTMGDLGALLGSFISTWDSQKVLYKRIDKELEKYESAVSKSSGKDLRLEQVNLEEEIDSIDF